MPTIKCELDKRLILASVKSTEPFEFCRNFAEQFRTITEQFELPPISRVESLALRRRPVFFSIFPLFPPPNSMESVLEVVRCGPPSSNQNPAGCGGPFRTSVLFIPVMIWVEGKHLVNKVVNLWESCHGNKKLRNLLVAELQEVF